MLPRMKFIPGTVLNRQTLPPQSPSLYIDLIPEFKPPAIEPPVWTPRQNSFIGRISRSMTGLGPPVLPRLRPSNSPPAPRLAPLRLEGLFSTITSEQIQPQQSAAQTFAHSQREDDAGLSPPKKGQTSDSLRGSNTEASNVVRVAPSVPDAPRTDLSTVATIGSSALPTTRNDDTQASDAARESRSSPDARQPDLPTVAASRALVLLATHHHDTHVSDAEREARSVPDAPQVALLMETGSSAALLPTTRNSSTPTSQTGSPTGSGNVAGNFSRPPSGARNSGPNSSRAGAISNVRLYADTTRRAVVEAQTQEEEGARQRRGKKRGVADVELTDCEEQMSDDVQATLHAGAASSAREPVLVRHGMMTRSRTAALSAAGGSQGGPAAKRPRVRSPDSSCAMCPVRLQPDGAGSTDLRMVSEGRQGFLCALCRERFDTGARETGQVSEMHRSISEHRCGECGVAFSDAEELATHRCSAQGSGRGGGRS